MFLSYVAAARRRDRRLADVPVADAVRDASRTPHETFLHYVSWTDKLYCIFFIAHLLLFNFDISVEFVIYLHFAKFRAQLNYVRFDIIIIVHE